MRNVSFCTDETPCLDSLFSIVWWLQIGANDLAITQCAEEVVILGILRLADEIKVKHPQSVVVIQGILPRSSFADGHVRSIKNSTHASKRLFHHSDKEYVKVEEYPLWPSIQLINSEVAKFCAKHEHLVSICLGRQGFLVLGYYYSNPSFLLTIGILRCL